MVQQRIFMQLIVSISVADMLGNWPYCLSENPDPGTVLCRVEGFANLYFFPVSWILTTFLTLLFRDLLIRGKILYSRAFVFGVSAVVPLPISLIYLAFEGYGTDDDKEFHTCTYHHKAQVFHEITYDGILGVCLIIMGIMLLQVLKHEYDHLVQDMDKSYRMVRNILTLYPVALILCWAPHSVCLLIPACNHDFSEQIYINIIKIAHGGLVAVIFFTMNKDARKRWAVLLRCNSSKGKNDRLVASCVAHSDVLSEGNLPTDSDLTSLMLVTRDGEIVSRISTKSNMDFGPAMDMNESFHSIL
jgi:multidrug transporter EmrE-like cation transporter